MEKKKYAAYGMLLAGTALLAVGVQNFLEPMELVAGGISGLGMILDDVSRRLGGPAVPLWLVNTALNVPLFLLAWYAQGRQFLGKDHTDFPFVFCDALHCGKISYVSWGFADSGSLWRCAYGSWSGIGAAGRRDHRRRGFGGGIAS